ncbi:alpha/beta fold hydrolase [Natrinema altunense]|uniref:Alpha/beta hydrolase fold protein n=1 Tax=Natrinema altunense (strain JCM 12890 / CGMCC 1.3731 / AJ2) TaxID=1227494 RepID=M0A0T6_NATA2|nr:alpha/beta hydrolase [Natrinema altunense]ELY91941.1 alpha/beta hydrolase fold protein [Natrinema altunense JCM 12890]
MSRLTYPSELDLESNWASGEIVANGCRHRFVKTGTGEEPPVLFAHGFTDNWQCLAPLAAQFADEHEVILYDARGHGLSEAPETGYDAETMTDDLLALCDALNVERPILYGHSLGADSIARATARSGLQPRALVLEDHPAQLFEALGEDHLPNKRAQLDRWSTATHESLRDEFEPRYPRFADVLATARKQVRSQVLGITKRGFEPLETVLPDPPCPTLLLRPDPTVASYTTPSRDRRWATGTTTVRSVDGAGHTIFRDRPSVCLELLEEFLAERDIDR